MSVLDFNKYGFPRRTQIYLNPNLFGYYKKLWGKWKELKKSVCIKHLREISDNMKIRQDSGTAVMKVLLDSGDLEIKSPDFNLS